MIRVDIWTGLMHIGVNIVRLKGEKQSVPIVLLGGASQSGKSFLAGIIIKGLRELGYDPILVSMDDYYLTKEEILERGLAPREDEINFDEPQSVDLLGLVADLRALKQGMSFQRREMVYSSHSGKDGFPSAQRIRHDFVSASDGTILVVEGLFALHEHLEELGDYRVYIEQADDERRYERRIRRDTEERGFSLQVAKYRWSRFAEPGYRKFIDPRAIWNSRLDLWIENSY